MGIDSLTPPAIVGLVFALVAIGTAGIGVGMQGDALRYADKGEIPDIQGMVLGGTPGGAYETGKDFYRDLRSHYRRCASGLSMMANLILLVSVVAGVLAGLTSVSAVAWACGVLWLGTAAVAIRFSLNRRRQFREREDALEDRRIEYNSKFFGGIEKAMGTEYAKAAFKPILPFERVRW